MLIEKYKNELKNILNALKECDFTDLDEDNFYDDFVYSFKNKYKNNFKSNSGATKGVLIFQDLGFVIKIPFQWCGGDRLYGAEEGDECWDYCSQESHRYEMAVKQDVEKAFLSTEFVMWINDYPIYIQEIAEPLESIHDNSHSSSTNQDKDKVTNIIDDNCFNCINIEWEADLYVYYGEDYYIRLKNFIENYEIEDLRSSNIGYVGKAPVIFDYAGFND